MTDIALCNKLIQGHSCDSSTLIKMLAAQNHYTIVAYPVSYHYDVFSKGGNSLENKISFEYDLEDTDNNIGRGGSGQDKFVFTLLDWTNSQSVAARRIQYQIMGGQLKDSERLSKSKWKAVFGSE